MYAAPSFLITIASALAIAAATSCASADAVASSAAPETPIGIFAGYFPFDVLYGTPDEIGDSFGNTVSVSGAHIAVGSPGGACPPPATGPCGRVRVFARVGPTWVQEASLAAPSPQAESTFGLAVALDGDWLLVGAPFEDRLAGADAGNVYLFHYADGTWSPVEMNTPDEAGARLGRSVAISRSGLAAAGMPWQSRSSPPALSHNGAVATFSRDAAGEWSYEGVTRGDVPASNEHFGYTVALQTYLLPPGLLNGFALAVGAPGATLVGQANAGKAYAFDRDRDATQWTQRAAYGLGPLAGANDGFGSALSIDGGRIAFGVSHHQTATHDHTGSAYVARRNGADWMPYTLIEVPPADDAQDTMQYGFAIALEGDDLFIGAPGTDFSSVPPQNDAGAVYWYQRASTGNWEYQQRLHASPSLGGSLFGVAIGFDGTTAAFGAPGQIDSSGDSTGAVYVFEDDLIFADGFD